jgi:hypothetical protein
MIKIAFILFVLAGHLSNAHFTLSGELRPRTEFNHGYKTLATENQDWATITTRRTRLNVLYISEGIKTGIVLQDVRLWGSQKQLVENEDFAVSIHEAWGKVRLIKNLWIKAGRQELVYDDQRILGSVGWLQQGRSHDVTVLKLENKFKIHFGISHHQNADITRNFYNGADAYKNMQYLWFNKAIENSSLSLLALNNGVPVGETGKQITKYGKTLGGRFIQGFAIGSIASNLYFQTGKHPNGKNIRALNFLIEASLKKGLTAGFEFHSGNSYDKTEKVYAFTPLYGTNHKFNGFMDYFYVENHINSIGLYNAYQKYACTKNKIGFNADVHYFMSDGLIKDSAEKYLGTEIDFTLTNKIQDAVLLTTGWSTMLAGDGMKTLKGVTKTSGNNWAYLMLSLTPSFLK